MTQDQREAAKSLVRRYVSNTGDRKELFHALVFVNFLANESAFFATIAGEFPRCELDEDGDYLVDGAKIRHWNASGKEIGEMIDRLLAKIK